ncbi:polygalacturonase inhibitor-like [Iris pallida]|uniref:Polygalacturonase inhibitor-like n=1 Tax=Iris pallida TaxID=29817 RepID=A0AAX6HVZ2_IRIPA|nr:polygalacturonase inhibitor-like [Iris pallida]
MTPALTIAITILFFSLFSSSSSSACNKHDEKALLAFKSSFHYSTLTSWSKSTDCCSSWDHVGCDSSTGHVTSLRFSNDYENPRPVSLNGFIPGAIGDLSSLESLTFSCVDGLRGRIPSRLVKLEKLKHLVIYLTRVSGPVPPLLSKLTALTQLSLAGNRLSGAIPPSLGSLIHLTDMLLSGNRLRGSIPTSLFSKLANLTTLDLSRNRLTGPIPRSLAGLSSLAFVLFHGNRLTEDASFLFGRSRLVSQLNLAGNELAFDFSRVKFPLSMGYMDVSHNKIYGSISAQITELTRLSYTWATISFAERYRAEGASHCSVRTPMRTTNAYAENHCSHASKR